MCDLCIREELLYVKIEIQLNKGERMSLSYTQHASVCVSMCEREKDLSKASHILLYGSYFDKDLSKPKVWQEVHSCEVVIEILLLPLL